MENKYTSISESEIKCKNGSYVLKKTIDKKGNENIDVDITGNISFFRYRSINSFTIKQLLSNEFYASCPTEFNDPYDTYLTYNYRKILNESKKYQNAAIKNAIDNDPLIKNKLFIEKMTKDSIEEYKNLYKIASLTIHIDNPLMWGHYSSSSQGFAIEYSINQIYKLINDFSKLKANFITSQYDNQIFKNDLEKYIKYIKDIEILFAPCDYKTKDIDNTNELIWFMKKYNNMLNSNENELISNEIKQLTNKTFIKKSKHFRNALTIKKLDLWSYENEWRLIIGDSFNQKNKYLKIGNIKPKAIYFGEYINQNNKSLLSKIALINNINVYQMYSKMSNNINKLKYRKLTKEKLQKLSNNYDYIE